MPKNDDKNYGSKKDNKKSVQSNKNNQYELIDINVKKAQQDIKKIFDSAKVELDKFHKAQEDAMKKSTASMQKQYEDAFSNISKKYEQSLGNMSSKNAADALGGNSNTRSSNLNNTPNQKDKLAQQLSDLVKSNEDNNKLGTFDNKYGSNLAGKIGEQINKNYSKGLDSLADKIDSRAIRSNKTLTDEFSKLTDTQIKGMDNLNKIGPFIKAGELLFDGIKVVLDKWVSRFFDGMDKIVNTYESTYKQVSVITNTNQQNYQDWQNQVSKDLQDQGLANNATVSQAMEEMNSITQRGVTDFSKASEMSMQNVVNKVIAPYVDTTTSAYTDLQMKFGENFTNSISGMGGYLSDIAGSNRVFKSSINDVIDKLDPVALYAEKELMGDDAYAMVEKLVATGQMTEKQAVELVSQATDAVTDKYGALTSGNTAQAVAVATGQADDLGSAIKSLLGTSAIGQSDDEIMQGAASNALGTSGYISQNMDIEGVLNTALETAQDVENSSKTSEDYYKDLVDNFKNDQYNTAKEQKENYAENISTSVATFKEQYPDAYDFLKTIATGVTSIATFYIGDKLIGGIGNLLGVGSGSGGLLGKLGGSGGLFSKFLGKGSALTSSVEAGTTASSAASSTLAGFTTVAGGIALGALASKAIASAIQSAQQETYEKNVEAAKSKLEGTSLEGNAAAESAVAMGDTTGNENNNFLNKWGAGISSTVTGIGSVWNKAFGDVSDLNKNEFQLFKDKLIMVQGDGDDKQAYAYAWYLLADSAGRLSDISESVGDISRDDLKEYVNSDQFNESLINAVADDIVNNWNKGPYKSKDERQSSIDWSLYGLDGSHATGLEYVPVDGYVAQLHQGESVLTKGAADIVRSLGNISGETGMASAISNLFNIVATPIKDILGNSSNNMSGNSSSSKEIVDAIYYQTSVLESAISNIGKNSTSDNTGSNVNNKTNVLSMRTNYNSNLVNLVPSMR